MVRSPLRRALLALVLVSAAAAPVAPGRADLPPLIPRTILFGNPERTQPRISPDGKRLAWIAPDEKNVLQVWVKTLGKEDARKVTADPKRGIRRYVWAHDDRTLLYMQDSDGDENFHVYGVDLEAGHVRDYTPFQGVRAEVEFVSHKIRDRFLVSMNLRDRKVFDVYSVELRSGATAPVIENPGDVVGWVENDDLHVVGAQASRPDGGFTLRAREKDGPWRTLVEAPFGENVALLDVSADGKRAVVETSLGADTARVVERDIATGAERVVASSPKADADEVQIHPIRHVVEAVDFPVERRAWTIVDPSVKPDFAALAKLADGDFRVLSRDREDRTWIVSFDQDRGPVRYFAWDRAGRKGTYLFSSQPKLEGLSLAAMKPVTICARDGLVLHGYLSLPPGVPAKHLAFVLFPHGGPWARDSWGYLSVAQWLANRGYAVLQVNFRGSTGFGKKFLNAGNREWGKKMQDDLTDATEWAVKQGIADPRRLAVMGGSYGGYATLAAATFTPELFRCGVDIVGPSSIFTLIKTIPPYWKPLMGMFMQRVGNPEDPRDEVLLRAASPLFHAQRIRMPLLIGQGANDPRVKQAESEQIVAAIEKNGGRAVYVVYSDEGHGFARPENRIDFFARAEAFLAENLGGRAEPIQGERVPGSTATVRIVGPARAGPAR
jgi:dipeptidyl aminopeptidase/acylaminoacyl peptidase